MDNNFVPELLAPAGDFDCLKAAVQNGADCVYFGADSFSARASSTNFSLENIADAINYAKIRNVKTNLALNTLIKNEELNEAINIARVAYEAGIDGIIVQDLGLAKHLISIFPDLPIHASTQMTIYNLEGAKLAEQMGFSRVVLARELSISEIKNICKNTNLEIEVFIHGALCMSCSGQCLLSSMIGGRSGNRGKCAQPCRLQYDLIKSDAISTESMDSGYILSTRDVCGIDYLPELIKAGVKSFKIEGRMKNPEYVATVTQIYRKYMDLALESKPYSVDYSDKKILMQVFNRGGFSTGHLGDEYNKDLVYKEKPNNMGLLLGTVEHFNANNGHIKLTSNEVLSIGDTISLEKEKGVYTISELMLGNSNIEESFPFQTVTIGRMKGNISVGDKVYKITNKELSRIALDSINKENKKLKFNCGVSIKQDTPISITIASVSEDPHDVSSNIYFTVSSQVVPIQAKTSPITADRVINQISKTKNSPVEFENIHVDIDENLFLPSISALNELRRAAIEKIETVIVNRYSRELQQPISPIEFEKNNENKNTKKTVSILFNKFNKYFDYSLLEKVDRIYIPYIFFTDESYHDAIKTVSKKYNTYIYLPTISKNFSKYPFDKILEEYSKVKGFVLSNISHLELIDKYKDKYEFIANYTLNIFNDLTLQELSNSNINLLTISPELSKDTLNSLTNKYKTEMIVYGNLPVMNLNYCLLGRSNKCYLKCKKYCNYYSNFYLKDRLGLEFKLLFKNGITTIYNSKTTSIESDDLNVNSIRLDFLDETLTEINTAIKTHSSGQKLEGQNYTNGNLNREV